MSLIDKSKAEILDVLKVERGQYGLLKIRLDETEAQLAAANAEIKVWQDYWNCESPHDTHVQAGTSGPWRQLGNEQARANRLGHLADGLVGQLATAIAEIERLKTEGAKDVKLKEEI